MIQSQRWSTTETQNIFFWSLSLKWLRTIGNFLCNFVSLLFGVIIMGQENVSSYLHNKCIQVAVCM